MQLTAAPDRSRFPLPTTAQLAALPPGSEGTRATLKAMALITRQAMRDPQLRGLAVRIVGGVPGKNYPGEVVAVHAWVRKNIRYVRDVAGVETLTLPVYTVGQGAGDCDDQSMLVAALLGAIGHRCRFVAVGRSPEAMQHVFTETLLGSRWVAVETTEPWPVGKAPDPRAYPVRMVEHL